MSGPPETEPATKPFDPGRRWTPVSAPALLGDSRIVFRCAPTGEYALVPGRWHSGGFSVEPGAPGRGVEYDARTGAVRYNGETYDPAEFR